MHEKSQIFHKSKAGFQERYQTQIGGIIQLGRPLDTMMTFAVSLVGAGLVGFEGASQWVVWAVAASNALLCAASMMLNDWHDVSEDTINQPKRPIPSGRLSRRTALVLSVVTFGAALSITVAVDPRLALVSGCVVLLSTVYTLKLSRVPLVGNVIVAVASVFPIWCWLVLVPSVSSLVRFFILICILFRTGTEIFKDAEDRIGDHHSGVRTLATLWGTKKANVIAATLVCGSLVLGWTALYFQQTNSIYIVAVSLSSLLGIFMWHQTLFGTEKPKGYYVKLGWAILLLMVLALGLGVNAMAPERSAPNSVAARLAFEQIN